MYGTGYCLPMKYVEQKQKYEYTKFKHRPKSKKRSF